MCSALGLVVRDVRNMIWYTSSIVFRVKMFVDIMGLLVSIVLFLQAYWVRMTIRMGLRDPMIVMFDV